jgi:hypothetical protein
MDISLRDHSGPMTPIDIGADAMEEWLTAERAELLRSPLPEPKPATVPDPTTAGEALGLTSAAINRMMENLWAATSPEVIAAMTGESRPREKYISEVERYLEEARQSWAKRVSMVATRHRLAVLDLAIHNETDDNFSAVEAVVFIPGRVWAYLAPHPRCPHPARIHRQLRFDRDHLRAR